MLADVHAQLFVGLINSHNSGPKRGAMLATVNGFKWRRGPRIPLKAHPLWRHPTGPNNLNFTVVRRRISLENTLDLADRVLQRHPENAHKIIVGMPVQ